MNAIQRKILNKNFFFSNEKNLRNLQWEKLGFALENKPQVNRKWWLRAGLWHPYSKKNLAPLAAPLNPAVLLVQKAHFCSFKLSQSDATGIEFVGQPWNVFPSLLICTFIIHQKYLFFFFFSSVSILGYEILIKNSHNILHPWCFVPTAPQLYLSACTISLCTSKHRRGQKVNTLQGRRKGFPKGYEPP